ncbi:TonB-dependent receptor [Methylobacillus methanolivorans]
MKSNYLIHIAVLSAMTTSTYAAETAVLEEITVSSQTEKPSIKLNKVNTTSNRLGLTAKETPASIDSVDAETIRQRGDVSIREAVTRTVGISDIGTPGVGQSFSSRGFSGNNSVAQAEDGIRLITAAGTLTYPSDSWGYERIEVLRGPASALFGDASSGGIVNSVRKKASREASLEALVGIGTRGAYRSALGGTGALGDIGAFRIDASVMGGNGYIDRGDYDTKKIMTSWQFEPSDTVRVGFTLDHAEDSPAVNYGVPAVNGNLLYGLRKNNYNVENNKMDFVDTRARAKIEWDISPALSIKNETYWFHATRDWRYADDLRLNPATLRVTRAAFRNVDHDLKQIGNIFQLASNSSMFGRENRLAVGIDISRVDFMHKMNTNNTLTDTVDLYAPAAGSFITNQALRNNYAADLDQRALFLENAWNATDKLKLLVSLRKDYIDTKRKDYIAPAASSSQSFSPFTWRIGAVYDVTPDFSLYAQTSRGTDPITNMLGLNLDNAKFDLTRSRQYEMGIKHLLPQSKGEVTLAAYHIAKDDIITRSPTDPLISVQGGKQSSRGIEFTTTLLPVEHWRIDFNAALLDARFDELFEGNTGISRAGNTPSNVPEKLANAWVYYQTSQWEAGIGARYVGKRYASNSNNVAMAGYTVFDASAAWNVNKQMTLRANIRNLADKFYASMSNNNDQQLVVGAPRQLELTAEFRY